MKPVLLKQLIKQGVSLSNIEDCNNDTWSLVDGDTDSNYTTCDFTGKKGSCVKAQCLLKDGQTLYEVEVLESVAYILFGLAGAY